MRRYTMMLFLLLFLFQACAIPAYAAESATQDEKPADTGVIGKQIDAYYADEDNKPGLLERTISDGVISFANFLIKAFGMQDVTLLVFGKNPDPTEDGFLQGGNADADTRSGLYLGIFTEGMMNAIEALYTAFEHFLPYPVILALILIAFLLLWHGGFSSDGRTKGKDYATAFVVGLLSVRFGIYIWKFIADVVSYFTDLVWAIMVDAGLNPGLFLNTVWGTGEAGYDNMVSYRGFVVAVLVLLAAIMTAKLNYEYTMRAINLMVLLSTFVVCCVLTLFPRYRNALQTWWDQFISNMILPCAHALALGLFFLLLYFSNDGVSNWVIVAYLFGFSSIQNLVQRVIGAEQPDSKVGKALGFGTLIAMSRMFSGKGSNAGKGNNAKDQQRGSEETGGTSESAAFTGGDTASMGAAASSSPAPASTSNWRNRAAKTGKNVAGFALNQGTKGIGMALGTSVGLMAGKPMQGAIAGGLLGGAVGKGMTYAGVGAKHVGRGAINLGREAYAGFQARLYPERAEEGGQDTMEEANHTFVSSSVESGSGSGAGVGLYQEQPAMKRTMPSQTEQPFRSSLSVSQGEEIRATGQQSSVTGQASSSSMNGVLKMNQEDHHPPRTNPSTPSVSTHRQMDRGIGDHTASAKHTQTSRSMKHQSPSNINNINIEDRNHRRGKPSVDSGIVPKQTSLDETKSELPADSPPSSNAQPSRPSTGGKHYNYHV